MSFFSRIWHRDRKSDRPEEPAGATEIVFNRSDVRSALASPVVALAEVAASDMMDATELLHLAVAVEAAGLGGDDIVVEIGAYVGATTVYLHRVLAQLGNDVTPILSIDPFERFTPDKLNPRGGYRRYLKNITTAAAERRCAPLVGFSHDVHRLVPERIGLLIVDGDHKYESAASDLELYAGKVRPGGLVFMDDYNSEHYPGVVRAFDEFIAARADFRLLHQSWFAIAQRIAPER